MTHQSASETVTIVESSNLNQLANYSESITIRGSDGPAISWGSAEYRG